MRNNIIIDTDAYKITHHLQYVNGLTKLYSYGEPRSGGRFPTVSYIGLQMIVKDNFLTSVTSEMIDEAEEESYLTFGTDKYFNRSTWERVKNLGYLPITIRTLPEGLEVPVSNSLFTLESTEPWFATALNSLESVMMHVWYPTTIGTNSLYILRDIKPLVEKTGTLALLPFMVNDFGLRGATSLESGGRAGVGHLLHFMGSDNMTSSRFIKDYYGFKGRAKSVWATEHSVATSYGPGRGEFDYVNAQLDRAPDDAIISLVIDSYDSINFVKNVIGSEEIKNRIINRKGRIVLRPDSGDPKYMVLTILNLLEEIFGSYANEKGYKVINYNVGVIQGDGMKRETILSLYKHIIEYGWSTDNLVVGSGGGLLQEGFTRDTERFAIKASHGELNHIPFNIQKDPKTDPTKKSKTGELKVVSYESSYRTIRKEEEGEDLMRVLLHNGDFYPDKFENLLKRAAI